jgi:hypothetical protein
MARRTKHRLSLIECRWRGIIAEWRESGLSAPQFCDGKAFTAKKLYVWSSRLNRIDAHEKTYRGGTKVRIRRQSDQWVKLDVPELPARRR